MKEEEELIKKIGKDNAFRVPAGYFENFTAKLMDKLPENPVMPKVEVTMWTKMKPWVYMAAVFIGAALFIRVLHFTGSEKSEVQQQAKNELSQEQYIDNTVENSRMEDYQLYEYLTDAKD